MPGTVFTTNPAEFLRHPGVYVWEVDPPGFIVGDGSRKVGIAGATVRGPVDQPVDVTEFARFTEIFGGRAVPGTSTSANEVREFLLGKPFASFTVVRACAADATTAEADFPDAVPAPIVNIAATSPGAWGAALTGTVEAATDGDANHWDLVIKEAGVEVERHRNLDTSGTNDNLAQVIGDDLGNRVVVTKLAPGRPADVVDKALSDTAGSDGAIVDTDYTAAGRAIEQLRNYEGLRLCAVAELSTDPVKASILAAAEAANDRIWLMWNGDHGAAQADVIADVDGYRSQRVIYTYNSPFIIDPDTAAEIQVPPHSFMAATLHGTDVDIDPIQATNKAFLKAIQRLERDSITREDFIALKQAGICTIEKRKGYRWAEGVLTDRTPGKDRITRRRSVDELVLAVADRLEDMEGRKNTLTNRIMIGSEIVAYSQDLRDAERIIEDFVVDQTSQNTEAQREKGLEVIFWQIKLIGHMRAIVLKVEAGETVRITELAA